MLKKMFLMLLLASFSYLCAADGSLAPIESEKPMLVDVLQSLVTEVACQQEVSSEQAVEVVLTALEQDPMLVSAVTEHVTKKSAMDDARRLTERKKRDVMLIVAGICAGAFIVWGAPRVYKVLVEVMKLGQSGLQNQNGGNELERVIVDQPLVGNQLQIDTSDTTLSKEEKEVGQKVQDADEHKPQETAVGQNLEQKTIQEEPFNKVELNNESEQPPESDSEIGKMNDSKDENAYQARLIIQSSDEEELSVTQTAIATLENVEIAEINMLMPGIDVEENNNELSQERDLNDEVVEQPVDETKFSGKELEENAVGQKIDSQEEKEKFELNHEKSFVPAQSFDEASEDCLDDDVSLNNESGNNEEEEGDFNIPANKCFEEDTIDEWGAIEIEASKDDRY